MVALYIHVVYIVYGLVYVWSWAPKLFKALGTLMWLCPRRITWYCANFLFNWVRRRKPGNQENTSELVSSRMHEKSSLRICHRRIIWYCASLESLFPHGCPGSNPGGGVFRGFFSTAKLCFACVPVQIRAWASPQKANADFFGVFFMVMFWRGTIPLIKCSVQRNQRY